MKAWSLRYELAWTSFLTTLLALTLTASSLLLYELAMKSDHFDAPAKGAKKKALRARPFESGWNASRLLRVGGPFA